MSFKNTIVFEFGNRFLTTFNKHQKYMININLYFKAKF